jgi:hypothetical protein
MLIITNQNIAIFLFDIFKKDKSGTVEGNEILSEHSYDAGSIH